MPPKGSSQQQITPTDWIEMDDVEHDLDNVSLISESTDILVSALQGQRKGEEKSGGHERKKGKGRRGFYKLGGVDEAESSDATRLARGPGGTAEFGSAAHVIQLTSNLPQDTLLDDPATPSERTRPSRGSSCKISRSRCCEGFAAVLFVVFFVGSFVDPDAEVRVTVAGWGKDGVWSVRHTQSFHPNYLMIPFRCVRWSSTWRRCSRPQRKCAPRAATSASLPHWPPPRLPNPQSHRRTSRWQLQMSPDR